MNCLRPGRLRSGNLFKDFWVENKTTTLTTRGRPKSSFDKDTAVHCVKIGGEDVQVVEIATDAEVNAMLDRVFGE